jgi:phosphomannomutase
VVHAVRQAFFPHHRVIDIDGARIYFGEREWALVRASNTAPKLSLRFEATDQDGLDRIKRVLWEELARHLPGLAPF